MSIAGVFLDGTSGQPRLPFLLHGRLLPPQPWEILPGLILIGIGAAVLVVKILRRNTLPAGEEQ
jgi:hypothetical protein